MCDSQATVLLGRCQDCVANPSLCFTGIRPAHYTRPVDRARRRVDGILVVETMSALGLLHRAVQAMNEHDLDALVACFHPDYESIQPVHPQRSFRGREHVVRNWEWVFDRFPDFQAEVLDCVVQDNGVWTEWRWFATDTDGKEIEVRGVMILTTEDGTIRSGRLYLEPVRDS